MESSTPYSLSRRVPSATRPPLRGPLSLETRLRVESAHGRSLKASECSADYPVQPGSWGNRRGLEEAPRPWPGPHHPGRRLGRSFYAAAIPGGVAERLNAAVLKIARSVTPASG